MSLEMKNSCELCKTNLTHNSPAYICSYECTFCEICTENMQQECPNCAGELVSRPRRIETEPVGN